MEDRRWNLDALYTGYESDAYKKDVQRLSATVAELSAFADALSHENEAATLKKILESLNGYFELARKLESYVGLRASVDITDPVTKAEMTRNDKIMTGLAKASAKFDHYIASVADLEALISGDPYIAEHAFFLREIKENSRYKKSDEVEEVISRLGLTGSNAWGELQAHLTSTLEVSYRGETITLSQVRNLAYSNDPEVRKDAYEAELKAYDKIKDSSAFSLNSIKGCVNDLCELRGYESPLQMTLLQSRMQKETLDAMFGAIRKYLPRFRAYMRRKAEVLGHKNGLPWYDMFALLGISKQEYTVEESRALLVEQFSTFSRDLTAMIERAYDEAWIDFTPRKGKAGGAFCANLPFLDQSRILTNFDGSLSDCVTLAHELGHAYHGQQIAGHKPLNTDYTMPVAETASTFNETVIMQAAMRAASSKEERLMLVESALSDLNQVVVDIYSRYLFESEVFERRNSAFLFPKDLEDIMLRAQKQAYGDGLDPEYLHPCMWVCKGHYYGAGLNFYNFPYAFGALFARGLYARYLSEGEAFVPKYRELLKATTVSTVEEVAKMAGIDITKESFWEQSLEVVSGMIDEFFELTK
ncbi:MAG: M3 family oligoendopeptidase [Clostridiaceae bacterium]